MYKSLTPANPLRKILRLGMIVFPLLALISCGSAAGSNVAVTSPLPPLPPLPANVLEACRVHGMVKKDNSSEDLDSRECIYRDFWTTERYTPTSSLSRDPMDVPRFDGGVAHTLITESVCSPSIEWSPTGKPSLISTRKQTIQINEFAMIDKAADPNSWTNMISSTITSWSLYCHGFLGLN
jgi:hypothetical protein